MNRKPSGASAASILLVLGFCCADATQAQDAEREFSDRSGQFHVRAVVVQQNETKVKLRRSDGTEVIVDIQQLSQADQRYLRQRSEGVAGNVPPALTVGDAVEIQFGSHWYRGVLLKREPRRAFVSYDGYADSWNQWITLDKLRAPQSAGANSAGTSGAQSRTGPRSADDAGTKLPVGAWRIIESRERRIAEQEARAAARLQKSRDAARMDQPAEPSSSEQHQAKPEVDDGRTPIRVRLLIDDAGPYRDCIEKMVDRNCAANGWKRLPPDLDDTDSLQLTVVFRQSEQTVDLQNLGIQALLGNSKSIPVTTTYFNIMLEKGDDLIYLGHQQLDASKLAGVFKNRFGKSAEEQMRERVQFDPAIFENIKIPSDLSRRHVRGNRASPLTELAE